MRWFFPQIFLPTLVAFLLPLVVDAQSSFVFKDPLQNPSIACAIKGFIGGIYLIGTPVVVLAIAYGGFSFVWARGNAQKLVDARKHMLWVIFGAALFLGSWLLGTALMGTVSLIIPGLVKGFAC